MKKDMARVSNVFEFLNSFSTPLLISGCEHHCDPIWSQLLAYCKSNSLISPRDNSIPFPEVIFIWRLWLNWEYIKEKEAKKMLPLCCFCHHTWTRKVADERVDKNNLLINGLGAYFHMSFQLYSNNYVFKMVKNFVFYKKYDDSINEVKC